MLFAVGLILRLNRALNKYLYFESCFLSQKLNPPKNSEVNVLRLFCFLLTMLKRNKNISSISVFLSILFYSSFLDNLLSSGQRGSTINGITLRNQHDRNNY